MAKKRTSSYSHSSHSSHSEPRPKRLDRQITSTPALPTTAAATAIARQEPRGRLCGSAYPLVALGIADEVPDSRGEVLGFGGVRQSFHDLADTDCPPATEGTHHSTPYHITT